MNRFQHDNIDPKPTPEHRKAVMTVRFGVGINAKMSASRRERKQARNRANQTARRVSFWEKATS